MSSLNITSLPNEVLEEIFMNLELNDIKNLSLVCKNFNEVIGSSTAVMDRIKIRWDSRYGGFISSNRIYRNAGIQYVNKISTKLENFLMEASLTELNLRWCKLKTSEFQAIMKSINKTIVKLSISSLTFESDCDVVPVELPKLKEFTFRHSDKDSATILNIFHGAKNVEFLDYRYTSNMNSDYCLTFWRVIGSMEKLKDIELWGNFFEKLNFNDEILDANFKLEKLKIRNDTSDETHHKILKFIEMHRTSLKIFSWKGSEITSQLLQLILNMPALTDVKLLIISSSTVSAGLNRIVLSKNYSIRELGFVKFFVENQNTERLMRDFITNCRALKKLELKAYNITSETLFALANMNHLETLWLEISSSFVPIAMPHVKEMAIYSRNNTANVIEMIRLNTHLKKLIVAPYTKLHSDYENAIAELSPDAVVEEAQSFNDF